MTATETLHIKNFAGIQEAEIELSRMNVFIGPQASGKSVCAKLLFFFKEIVRRTGFEVGEQHSRAQMRAGHREKFLQYFPPATWGKGDFTIEYAFGELGVTVTRKGDASTSVNVSYSDYYLAFLRTGRDALLRAGRRALNEQAGSGQVSTGQRILFYDLARKVAKEIGPTLSNDNHFIPAGRSFFSSLELSVFSLIAADVPIDPFLAEFGQFYSNARRSYPSQRDAQENYGGNIAGRISTLICGTYRRISNRDFIFTDDGRQVAIENCSSGQQEALPLAVVLFAVGRDSGRSGHTTMFVEEPEAHLYPTAQREIVHLLADVTDLSSNENSSQYVITTHSPYILSALNNLMYGAQIAQEVPEKRSRVTQILDDAALVDPANVRAYAFGDGGVESIIDKKTGLVRATMLDGVSNELAKEFGALLDVAFEEMAA